MTPMELTRILTRGPTEMLPSKPPACNFAPETDPSTPGPAHDTPAALSRVNVPAPAEYPTGCVVEAGANSVKEVHFYNGSPFASNGYTTYTGAPFTPACKQLAASECAVGSSVVPGRRVAAIYTTDGVASTDTLLVSAIHQTS